MRSAFGQTRVLGFYKNDKTRSFANPMRRWYYHYIILGSMTVVGSYFFAAYQLAKWEAHAYGDTSGRCVCPYGVREALSLVPFNRLSNFVGQLAEPGPLPTSVHRKCIAYLIWFYNIDLSDAETTEFESLRDFYARRWVVGSRPVSTAAVAVSPCDGEVLALHENVTATALMQVKGLSYGIQSLLHTSPGPIPAGYKRVAAVLHLRVGDYHHVISPADVACIESVYVPGELLPTTAAGYHWLPSVLTTNERLVVHGRGTGSARPFIGLAMVGSTLTGRMSLAFDKRMRTNFLDPPDYAVHMNYNPPRKLPIGTPVGTFYWGSSVVLMLDVPDKAAFQCKVGDAIKAGAALLA